MICVKNLRQTFGLHSLQDLMHRERSSWPQSCRYPSVVSEAQKLIHCAVEFHDVSALDDSERGEEKGVDHSVDTAGSQPITKPDTSESTFCIA